MRQMRHSIALVPTKWRPTASTLCPTIEKALELCCSYAQNKVQKHQPPEISLATGGSFERNTFLVTDLEWLNEEDEQIKFLAVSGLPL